MSARSMTGFARAKATVGDLEIVVSVKTVNHRGLDIHFHMGAEFDPFENGLRNIVKAHINRGHVDLRVTAERLSPNAVLRIDEKRLRAYLELYKSAAAQFGISAAPDLNAALRFPGVLTDGGASDLASGFEAEFAALIQTALRSLNEFRTREGADLINVMTRRNRALEDAVAKMEDIRERALMLFHGRLKERLAELLGDASIDPQRLAQEAAILADRSDIGEEIARLKIHSKQLGQLLQTSGEIGKKLDFLLQEMNREANTILSKTSGIGEQGLAITDLALSAKSDIEKIREQGMNLE